MFICTGFVKRLTIEAQANASIIKSTISLHSSHT